MIEKNKNESPKINESPNSSNGNENSYCSLVSIFINVFLIIGFISAIFIVFYTKSYNISMFSNNGQLNKEQEINPSKIDLIYDEIDRCKKKIKSISDEIESITQYQNDFKHMINEIESNISSNSVVDSAGKPSAETSFSTSPASKANATKLKSAIHDLTLLNNISALYFYQESDMSALEILHKLDKSQISAKNEIAEIIKDNKSFDKDIMEIFLLLEQLNRCFEKKHTFFKIITIYKKSTINHEIENIKNMGDKGLDKLLILLESSKEKYLDKKNIIELAINKIREIKSLITIINDNTENTLSTISILTNIIDG